VSCLHCYARRVRSTTALIAALLAFAAAAAEASASNLVFVCGKNLCAASGEGRARIKLTSDGRARGGYSRPSLSRNGERLAFKLGDPGRVWTAIVKRKRGRVVGLGRRNRIEAFRDGPRDATQFDVAISPDGVRVAWVEIRANVVFGGFDFRRYSARLTGGGARQEASNGGRPFVGWANDSEIIREGLAPDFDGESVDAGLCVPSPQSASNGTCTQGSRQLALDPAGRHLRHPSLAVGGRLLVATAYIYGSPDIDDAIERPGAIALFDTASAAPVRDLTAGPGDLYPSFAPNGRTVAFERGGAVWTVRTSAGKPRRLLRRARQPTWAK
jgi:WD40-like Beta Propeller Repeat